MKVAQLDVDIKGGDHIHVPAEQVQIDQTRREVPIQGYAPGAYRRPRLPTDPLTKTSA